MPAKDQWRLLHLQLEDLPTLLIRSTFSKSAFEVHLSDLSRVWSQSWSTKEIKKHALNNDGPIDPTEDPSQMLMLLSKIESAVHQDDDASMSLQSQDASGIGLTMHLSVPLPSPLPALEWTLDLQQLPSEQVAAELVNPLLLEADLLRRQMQQLVSEIQDKDRVIARLSDRLEASGNNLTEVFPGISNIRLNRKKPQRDQLARHIKGLADFDEAEWRVRKADHVADAPLATQALKSVLAELKAPELPIEPDAAAVAWWKRLDGSRLTRDMPGRSTQRAQREQEASANGPPLEAKESIEDDEFQRQQTPPGLRQGSVNAVDAAPAPVNGALNDEESTEDEDDLDAPPKKSQSSSQTLQKQSQLSAKSTSKSPSPAVNTRASKAAALASPAPKSRKFGTLGGRSATPKSPAERDRTPQPPEEVSPPKKTAPKGRFGTIGGKVKPAPAGPESPELAVPEPTTPSRGKRLGTIGGKKDSTTASPLKAPSEAPENANEQASEQLTGRARSRQQSTPPAARETSQERADKKRKQLERDLAEKAKAPVKKKRKF